MSPRCCVEDGSRSPGVGLQGRASNHRVLLRSKGVVVSNAANGDRQGCQVGVENVSASEPLDRWCIVAAKLRQSVS
jgi:hypothetical protein